MKEETEELYAAFAACRLPNDHVGCPDCVSPEDKRRLYAHPLREMSMDDLERYTWKAMTTWGDAALFRHFLPRILELLYLHGDAFTEPEVVTGKLPYAKWTTWEERQQNAVRRFFTAWWAALLGGKVSGDSRLEPDRFLCMVACAGLPLEPYLTSWRDEAGLPATRLFAEMLLSGEWPDMSGIGNGAWWKEHQAEGMALRKWLLSAGWANRLEKEALAHAGEDWSESWMRAAEMLRAEARS